MLVWLDIETTGLNPNTGAILEIALVATDDSLNVMASNSWVIQPLSMAVFDRLPQEVIEMHMANGLMLELMSGTAPSLAQVADLIHGWWRLNVHELHIHAPKDEKPPMCGSSVGFDRKWLEHHVPILSDLFHYRNIDVSTIKELLRRWSPDMVYRSDSSPAHRALPDITNSIAELAHYRKALGFDTSPVILAEV